MVLKNWCGRFWKNVCRILRETFLYIVKHIWPMPCQSQVCQTVNPFTRICNPFLNRPGYPACFYTMRLQICLVDITLFYLRVSEKFKPLLYCMNYNTWTVDDTEDRGLVDKRRQQLVIRWATTTTRRAAATTHRAATTTRRATAITCFLVINQWLKEKWDILRTSNKRILCVVVKPISCCRRLPTHPLLSVLQYNFL